MEHKGYNIIVEQEEEPCDPRGDDNLGKMICFHGRYNLGDEHKYSNDKYGALAAAHAVPKGSVVLKLYLYDHGGITMSTTPFSCQFDSGQVGVIYASPEAIRRNFGTERISKKQRALVENILRAEVQEYDQYLTGDIWAYVIEDQDGEIIECCGNYYGEDDAETAAKESAEELYNAAARENFPLFFQPGHEAVAA